MTITLFILPRTLGAFIKEMLILKGLSIYNDYKVDPSQFVYSESMISDYVWVNIEVEEYVKLTDCINRFKKSK